MHIPRIGVAVVAAAALIAGPSAALASSGTFTLGPVTIASSSSPFAAWHD
jgi:hypothetical protein